VANDELTAALTAPGQPFEIAEATIRGAATRIWKNAPQTLPQIVEASRSHGKRAFLVYGAERVSFEEHYRQVAAFAHHLVEERGVRKGDRVAIAMRNYPEWAVAFCGAACAGAIVVPLNAWGSADELAYALGDSGSRVVVADRSRAALIDGARGRLGLRHCLGARFERDLPGWDVFAEATADAKSALPTLALGPEDDATIFYTSGTTGRPKGALGTHRNLCGAPMSSAFLGLRSALRAGVDPGELAARAQHPPIYLLTVPLFHVTGCQGMLLGALSSGGRLVMLHKWDPARALEAIEAEGVTALAGVPAMMWQIADEPSLAKRDTSSLQSISYGGAPAPPELLRRLRRAFPDAAPANGYGITETSSVVSLNAGPDYEERPDSVGLPLPVCDLRVVDETGAERPPGELGELHVRGPNVVRAYWNAPEATCASFADGWFRTGDLVRLDEQGFLTVLDRMKDIVIRGGENILCPEVEAVLLEHPAVGEAAVLGVHDRVLGEEVVAVVRPRPGATAVEQELRDHVASRLAAFKVPARVWLWDEALPRNPAGKILKRELRERLES